MVIITRILFSAALAVLLICSIDAQTSKNSKPQTTAPEPTPSKRNARPAVDTPSKIDPKSRSIASAKMQSPATHFYEFTRPGFSYGKIVIEHNDQGQGTISFLKDGHDEMLTDPVELSGKTMLNIGGALSELAFLDSTEEYQFPRDYSHLGNVSFTLKRDGRARTVRYNWTENKSAKALMDEYRRIANEYTWKFEILLARENMPLQTPGLLDAIEAYFKRNEISDPPHLVPFLNQLYNDERIPLMARNKAGKLMKEIEKQKP